MYATGLTCIGCGRHYRLEALYNCPECGNILDVVYDYPRLKSDYKAGRLDAGDLSPFLPLDEQAGASVALPPTPLIRADRLAARLGVKKLLFKCEFLNPTGSFKDRPIAVAVAKAKEFGLGRVIIASSGNAAAAAAAYAGRSELTALVLVPEATPPEKIRQTAFYGATVVKVKGPYSNCFSLAKQAATELDYFNLTTTFINPYTVEGDKIIAHEIVRQTGEAPAQVFVPVGAGPLLVGLHKGFKECELLGMSAAVPQMVGVQATGCNPIAQAFSDGMVTVKAVKNPATIAGGICDGLYGYSQDGDYTLATIRRSDGYALAVADEDINEAMRLIAREEGLFVEPSGAVALAGLIQSLKNEQIAPDTTIVAMLTGHGLKDMAAISQREVPVIDDDVEQLKRVMM
jgi:threonine synthase